MKRIPGLLVPVPLFFLIGCSFIGAPSNRPSVEYPRQDVATVRCVAPPPDVVAKGVSAKADVAADRVGTLLKGTGGASIDVERIRQEVPVDVAAFEVIDYRLCVQYANGVLSKEEYNAFTQQILPTIKKTPQQNEDAKRRAEVLREYARTCEQPTVVLKEKPEEFFLGWDAVLGRLRKRNVHDLQNIFEVMGRVPSGSTMKEMIREALFFLNCLEKNGELTLKKTGTTGRYLAEDFENQTIIFRSTF